MDLKISQLLRYHKRTQLALLSLGVFVIFISILVVNLAVNSDQLKSLFASAAEAGQCRVSLSGVNSCMMGDGRGLRIYNMVSSGPGCNYRGNPASLYFTVRDLAPGQSVCQSQEWFRNQLEGSGNWGNCCSNWSDLGSKQPAGQPRPTNSLPNRQTPTNRPIRKCQVRRLSTTNQCSRGMYKRATFECWGDNRKISSDVKARGSESVPPCLNKEQWQAEAQQLCNERCAAQSGGSPDNSRGSGQGQTQITNIPTICGRDCTVNGQPSSCPTGFTCRRTICPLGTQCTSQISYSCYDSRWPNDYNCDGVGSDPWDPIIVPTGDTVRSFPTSCSYVENSLSPSLECDTRNSYETVRFQCRDTIGTSTTHQLDGVDYLNSIQKDGCSLVGGRMRCLNDVNCKTRSQWLTLATNSCSAQCGVYRSSSIGGPIGSLYPSPTSRTQKDPLCTNQYCTTSASCNSYVPGPGGQTPAQQVCRLDPIRGGNQKYCCVVPEAGGSGSNGYGTAGDSSAISCGFWPCPYGFSCVNSYCVAENSY